MGRKRHSFHQIKKQNIAEKSNELFEKYYKAQKEIIPDEEWDTFISALRSELPSTFRVTGFREQSQELFWLLKNRFLDNLTNQKTPVPDMSDSAVDAKKEDGEVEEQRLVRPEPLLWYPKEMAWQLNATRVQIRRSAELKRLHQFLISETESGYISRQEAVSMIPPLLLDVQSHHRVLDICAAPGSKTAQLVEMIHSSHVAQGGTGMDPDGYVVANDVDGKRCYMMIHQVARLQSPCVVITRHDATNYPRFFEADPNKQNTGGSGLRQVLFDRILADVPCSGDGTLRKNPDLWARWSPNLGLAEHFLQAKILRRSLELLTVGGRMIYSTCSMNAVEDEAVVASILNECEGQVRILDVSGCLPHLRFQPGRTDWRIMLKSGVWCSKMEEVPDTHLRFIRPSLFPPDNAASLGLEKCMRILPHYQNTGGFFVAVLEKTGSLPWMKVKKEKQLTETTEEVLTNAEANSNGDSALPTLNQEAVDNSKDTKDLSAAMVEKVEEMTSEVTSHQRESDGQPSKKKQRVFREEPFFFMTEEDPDLAKLRTYYGLSETFPATQLMYRCDQGKRRNFYFANKAVRDLVEGNRSRDINFINLGVRLFGVSEDKYYSGYRLLQDGVAIADSVVGEARRIHLSRRSEVLTLLQYDMPLATNFGESTMRRFHQLEIGPVLIDYIPSENKQKDTSKPAAEMDTPINDEDLPRCRLLFTGWRGKTSLRHYVNDHERQHLLRLCGVEPEPVKSAMMKNQYPEHLPSSPSAVLMSPEKDSSPSIPVQ